MQRISRHRLTHQATCSVLLPVALLLGGCKQAEPVPDKTPELQSQIWNTRVELAQARLTSGEPDAALSILCAVLREKPDFPDALAMAGTIIRENAWSVPVLRIDHRLPVDHLALNADSLWVGLTGDSHTLVRWDLANNTLSAALFPRPGQSTHTLIPSPDGNRIVIERAEATLLCDAQTLKPVTELGAPPDDLARESVIVFSNDGILLAHPTLSPDGKSHIWHIRDAASGEIIRDSEPAPQPLAAHLDHRRLRVLHADGGLLEIPVSPIDEATTTPFSEQVRLRHAQFDIRGDNALASIENGPLQAPTLAAFSVTESEAGGISCDDLLRRFPWHAKPGIWTGLMRDDHPPRFLIKENTLAFADPRLPRVPAESGITSFAIHGDIIAVGEESGTVTLHRILPRYDAGFDVLETAAHLTDNGRGDCTRVNGQALLPLWQRLAEADSKGDSWPDLLAMTKDLKATEWHRELTAAMLQRVSKQPVEQAGHEWLLEEKVSQKFAAGDHEAVLQIISKTGGKGPAAARAMELALASDNADWIAACLSHAKDIPPLVEKIARSRISWLLKQKAEAFAIWQDDPPDIVAVRRIEDWSGWEQADFSTALAALRQSFDAELATLEIPEDATAEQRTAVAARLLDAGTPARVGKKHFATACLKAALFTAPFKEDTEATFKLANLARHWGAPPVPCLRAEALSLTALGDYQNAQTRWIHLITEEPVDTHEPGDYAEAAYTSFENSDPRQAMEILNTGITRFPEDANFALRAGWVALLTDHPERALHYLLQGLRIGYPEEKMENATALLTIAAVQLGDVDQARQHYDSLIAIDPAWADPDTLETLEWPDALKAALRQMTW